MKTAEQILEGINCRLDRIIKMIDDLQCLEDQSLKHLYDDYQGRLDELESLKDWILEQGVIS